MTPRVAVLGLACATALAIPPTRAFSQGEGACPANSHPAGDGCRCDPGYMIPKGGGSCVPAAEACRSWGEAHAEGGRCVCNAGYALLRGSERCVNVAERCARINAVFQKDRGCVCRPGDAQFGDDPRCVNAAAYCRRFNAVFDASTGGCGCPPGSAMLDGTPRCTTFKAFCARFDAVYNPSTDKCECPPGTVDDEDLGRCVPVSGGKAPPPEGSGRPAESAPPPQRPARSEPPRPALPDTEAPPPRVDPAGAVPVASERPASAGSRTAASADPGEPTPSRPAREASPARGSNAAPGAPAGGATSPRETAAGRTADLPATPSPPSDLSEPIIGLEYTSLSEEIEVTQEIRESAQGTLLEVAAAESPEAKARVERELDTFNGFMPLDEGSSIGGSEVRLGPVLPHMKEARRLQVSHEEFGVEMAAWDQEADKVREAETLKPGVDPKRYKAAVWGLERIRATLAWAEKEHMHQNVRYFEARYGDEGNLKSANFRSLGKEHRERFKVPVGQEKRYAGYTDDVVQALASRDCVLNMKGAYEQMLRAREELKRAEAEVDSMLALPEKPRLSEADRAAFRWYRGLGRGY